MSTTNLILSGSNSGSLGIPSKPWTAVYANEFHGDGSNLTGITGTQGPAGPTGADGDSAYDTWLANGNTGTEQEFLNSLVGLDGATGPAGATGADGDSAYETWLDEGNSGTQQDFLDSLVGPTGPQGPAGSVSGSVDMGGTMTAHIIPDSNAAYDLGNAEYKIRHLFLSDNSLWVGENHKISIGDDGKMKFRKRKTNDLPLALRGKGIADDPGSITLARLHELATEHGLSPEALFDGDDFDEENDEAALTALQDQVNALGASIPDVSGFATKAEIPDISNLATTDQIPDVSGFATTDQIPDVSGFATTAEVPTNVSELTNDANYTRDVDLASVATSGDYNDLSGKPDVSALIATAVDGIVDGAPGTLNTLNEIAAAIADDANIATTLTTAISTEQARAEAAEQANADAIAAIPELTLPNGTLYVTPTSERAYAENFEGLTGPQLDPGNPSQNGTWQNGEGNKDGSDASNAFPWALAETDLGSTYRGPSGPYSGGKYIYTEATNTQDGITRRPDKFYSLTKFIPASENILEKLSFYYFGHGVFGNTGQEDAFWVKLSEDGTNWTTAAITKDADGTPSVVNALGEEHDSQSEPWKRAEVDLSAYDNKDLYIRLLGKTGGSYNGEFAIDYIDFELKPYALYSNNGPVKAPEFIGDFIGNGSNLTGVDYNSLENIPVDYFSSPDNNGEVDLSVSHLGASTIGTSGSVEAAIVLEEGNYAKFPKGFKYSPSVLVSNARSFEEDMWIRVAKLEDPDSLSYLQNHGLGMTFLIGLSGDDMTDGVTGDAVDASFIVNVRYASTDHAPLVAGTPVITCEPLNATDLAGFDPTTDLVFNLGMTQYNPLTWDSIDPPQWDGGLWIKSRQRGRTCHVSILGGNADRDAQTTQDPWYIATDSTWQLELPSTGMAWDDLYYGRWADKVFRDLTVNSLTVGGTPLHQVATSGDYDDLTNKPDTTKFDMTFVGTTDDSEGGQWIKVATMGAVTSTDFSPTAKIDIVRMGHTDEMYWDQLRSDSFTVVLRNYMHHYFKFPGDPNWMTYRHLRKTSARVTGVDWNSIDLDPTTDIKVVTKMNNYGINQESAELWMRMPSGINYGFKVYARVSHSLHSDESENWEINTNQSPTPTEPTGDYAYEEGRERYNNYIDTNPSFAGMRYPGGTNSPGMERFGEWADPSPAAETAITAEETRATAAEQANATAITANATAITAEETRATAAEAANATAITAEETRATAAEAALQSNIDSLGGLSIAEVYIHNTSAGTGTGTYKEITTSYTRLSNNHRIDFVAPANGKVKLKFIGMFSGIDSSVGSEETGDEVYVAVRHRAYGDDGAGPHITDASGVVWDGNKFMQTDESGNHMQTIEINQDGLTPGETYRYEFMFKKGSNDTDVRLSFGADFAATIIRAETLPSNLQVKTS